MRRSTLEVAVITAAAKTVYENIHKPAARSALLKLRSYMIVNNVAVTIADGYATATDNVIFHRISLEAMLHPMLLLDIIFGHDIGITVDEVVKFSLKDLTTEKLTLPW